MSIVETEEVDEVGKSLVLKRDLIYLRKGTNESFIGKKILLYGSGVR